MRDFIKELVNIDYVYTNQFSSFYWLVISLVMVMITNSQTFLGMASFFTIVVILNVIADIWFHYYRKRKNNELQK